MRRRPKEAGMPAKPSDFVWGPPHRGVELGLWASANVVQIPAFVELRAAARNSSAQPIRLGPNFGLVTQRGDNPPNEDFSGPRSTAPIDLAPGEFRVLLGWRLGGDAGLLAGRYACWAVYRPDAETEIRSGPLYVEVRDAHP